MKTVLLLITALACSYAHSQDTTTIKPPIQVQGLLQYDFPESYGISGGIVFQVSSSHYKKNYRNSADYHLWIASFEATWRHYPLNSSAIDVHAGIGVRISKYPGHYHEWLIEEGILRSFYSGTVYTISSDGSVKELSGFGRIYATTGFSYLQNWNLNVSKHPVSLIVKPTLWIQYPFNGFIKLHTSLKIGARYSFNHKKSFRYAS